MLTNSDSKQKKMFHLISFIGFLLLQNVFAFILLQSDKYDHSIEPSIIALNVLILIHLVILICIRKFNYTQNYLLVFLAISIQITQNEYGLLLTKYQNSQIGLLYQFISGQFIFYFKISIFHFNFTKPTLIAQIGLYFYFSFRSIYVNQQLNYAQIISETLIFIPVTLPICQTLFKAQFDIESTNQEKLFSSILFHVKEGIIVLDSLSNVIFQNKIVLQKLGNLDDDIFNLKLSGLQKQWSENIAKEFLTNNDQHLISFQNTSKPLTELTTLREVIEQLMESQNFIKFEDLAYKNLIFHLIINQIIIDKKKYSILKFEFKEDECVKENFYIQQSIISQAKLCHEIKNPLNAIIAMLEFITEQQEENYHSQYISSCLQAAKLLSSLLSDLQDKAQLSKNKFLANYTTFNIKQLMNELIAMFQFQTEKKLILIEYKIQSNITYITSDENRLKQIIINLISNAIKFTPPSGTIFILISKFSQNILKISVKDSGVGISEENKKMLFSDFGKIKETNKLNSFGVGLGLSISQELALLLGPEGNKGIQVVSEQGKGSEFYFYIVNLLTEENFISSEDILSENELDIKENNFEKISENIVKKRFKSQLSFQVPSIKKISSQKHVSHNFAHRKTQKNTIINALVNKQESQMLSKILVDFQDETKILIVDDDAFNLQAFESILNLLGINSDTALSGKQAITLVKQKLDKKENYNLIFMDFEMPEMDGLSTSKQISKMIDQAQMKTFIIGCTGYSNMILEQDTGIKEILEKPITKKKIQCILKKFCRN